MVERRRERETNGVLDEARLQVRVLDDEQLVGPLQQLVDGRAHRTLDDLDEVLRVDLRLGADEQRAASALVVRRERDELEDALDVAVGEPGLEQPVGRGAAHEPLRARARVDAEASTPTTRRTCCGDAAAIPISVAISCVGRPLTGVRRSSGYCASIRTSARSASWRSTMCARDVLGQRLDEERLADHDLVDRLAEELGEPRHVHAFLGRVEIDGARDLGGERLLAALVADPDRLLDAGHAGAGQAERDVGRRRLQVDGRCVRECSPSGMNRSAHGGSRTLSAPRLAGLPRPENAARDDLRLCAHTHAGGGATTIGRCGSSG